MHIIQQMHIFKTQITLTKTHYCIFFNVTFYCHHQTHILYLLQWYPVGYYLNVCDQTHNYQPKQRHIIVLSSLADVFVVFMIQIYQRLYSNVWISGSSRSYTIISLRCVTSCVTLHCFLFMWHFLEFRPQTDQTHKCQLTMHTPNQRHFAAFSSLWRFLVIIRLIRCFYRSEVGPISCDAHSL